MEIKITEVEANFVLNMISTFLKRGAVEPDEMLSLALFRETLIDKLAEPDMEEKEDNEKESVPMDGEVSSTKNTRNGSTKPNKKQT